MTLKTKSTISFEEDERKILQTASDLILALFREMKHHNTSWAIDHSGGIWHAENEIEDFSAGNFDEQTEDAEIIFKHVLCFPDLKSLPPNADGVPLTRATDFQKNFQKTLDKMNLL